MVKVREDLTGMTFGRLTVLKQVEDYIDGNERHYAQYLCECSCELHKQVVVRASNLKKENGTRSCGCIYKENRIAVVKKYNNYNYSKSYGVGYCHNTDSEFYFDWEDYDKIKNYCWSEHVNPGTGYTKLEAKEPGTNKVVAMSHILGFKNYDHKNRNPLDNRKENFRLATAVENCQNRNKRKDNTSGVTGVWWNKYANRWIAYITVNKNFINLGRFINKTEAIITRLNAENKYFKEFAPQRHLFKEYGITPVDKEDNNELQ